jgi:hypothetical protein
MTLVGCDLHSRKQQVAVLDTTTSEVREQELAMDGDGENAPGVLTLLLGRWTSLHCTCLVGPLYLSHHFARGYHAGGRHR